MTDTEIVSREITYGDTLQLDCLATGLPPPVYHWTKDDTSVHQVGFIRLENSGALLINRKVTQNDGGKYACNASNSAGYRTKRWQVSVAGQSPAENEHTWLITGISVGVVLLVLTSILVVLCRRLRKVKEQIMGIPMQRRATRTSVYVQ